jgi:alkanesulfonate monooxygenase SsuD/methylene tetrahydromethanopterin reductase-like flavin-dependent oxidoreductase (luciferase family)
MPGWSPESRMCLGVTVPFEGVPMHEVPRLVAWAEALGYEEAWSYERNLYDAFTPLAAAAVASTRIRLGVSVAPAFTRPAGLLAMSAAAMAELAPGRFRLGIGASTRAVVTHWMGLPYERPRSRVHAAVRDVRALLAGDRVGSMRLHRKPPVEVPLFIGALGERMLELAGEIADGVALFLAGPRIIPDLLAAVKRPIDSVLRLAVITGEDHEANLAFARRYIAGYVIVPAYARFLRRQGFGADVDAILACWSAGDRHAAVSEVSDAMVHELVLIDCGSGLEERVARFQKTGIGCLDLWLMSTAGNDAQRLCDVERLLDRLAPRNVLAGAASLASGGVNGRRG